MNDDQKCVFLETLGINIDLDQLTLLETIARKQRRSVEEIILEAVLRYVHRKSPFFRCRRLASECFDIFEYIASTLA